MRNLILAFISAAAAIVALTTGLLFLAYKTEQAQCHAKWGNHGEVEFSFMTGCRVMIDGTWWPTDAIKVDPR